MIEHAPFDPRPALHAQGIQRSATVELAKEGVRGVEQAQLGLRHHDHELATALLERAQRVAIPEAASECRKPGADKLGRPGTCEDERISGCRDLASETRHLAQEASQCSLHFGTHGSERGRGAGEHHGAEATPGCVERRTFELAVAKPELVAVLIRRQAHRRWRSRRPCDALWGLHRLRAGSEPHAGRREPQDQR